MQGASRLRDGWVRRRRHYREREACGKGGVWAHGCGVSRRSWVGHPGDAMAGEGACDGGGIARVARRAGGVEVGRGTRQWRGDRLTQYGGHGAATRHGWCSAVS
jgi:hypothetical protein